MRKNVLMLFALLIACTQLAFAQNRHVKGKVLDEKGVGLPGAGVVVKNTTNGTMTDGDGNFDLDIPNGEKMVVVKATGYADMEVEVKDNGMIVNMKVLVKELHETVITALGIKREAKTLSYATQTVSGEDMNKSGTGNAFSELDGKVAGLQVINASGDPGAGTFIQLRGTTSLTGDNQPLIVIDGIPVDNSINNFDPTGSGFQASGANGNLTGGSQPTNRGLDINPNDIESISTLKGPAATALYGIRAANGVLMITTKKGNAAGEHGMHVSINSSTSIESINKFPELQNQFSEGTGGKYSYPNRVTWGASMDTLYYDGKKGLVSDPNGNIVGKSDPTATSKKANLYNPQDFFQNGMTTNNNVAVSGGDDKNSYRLSLGNLHQTGVAPKSKYDKSTFSISGQSQINDKLSATGSMSYIGSGNDKVQQGSNTSGIMLGLLRTPPSFDNSYGLSNAASNSDASAYLTPNGTQRNYRNGPGYDNPFWTVNRNPSHDDLNRAMGYGQLTYKVFDWMDLTYRLGGDVYAQTSKQAYDVHSNGVASGAGEINLIDYFNRQYNSDFIVSMHKTFNTDMSGSLILGQNYYSQVSTTRFAQGTNLTVPGFLDMSNATSNLASEGEGKVRRMAWYGQATMDYKNMLYLTLTGRDETTSTLAAGNDNFFYPSAGLSFIFTEPLKLSGSNVLSYGKLRLSYADAGKDAPWQSLQTYYKSAAVADGFTSGLTWPIAGYTGYQLSSSTTVIGNPDLKPEHTRSYEVGTDLSFFHNKLSFNGTFYYAHTTDAIISVPIAYSTGFGAALLNAAEISNHGFELTLNTTPIRTKYGLRWDLAFNWSKNVNTVNTLAKGVDNLFVSGFQNGSIVDVAGHPAGLIYGTTYIRDPKTGQMLINDDKTSAGYGMPIVDPNATNKIIGNTNPDWIGSIISNLSYKGFAFGFQIAMRMGGQMWDGTRGAIDYFGTGADTKNRNDSTVFNGVAGHLDANGNIVTAGAKNTAYGKTNQYYWQNIGSSFLGPTESTVEDASFIKLRQISLSYAFPQSMISKTHLKSLSVTLFMNNVILWTKYKGIDPETSLAGPANGQGLDYFNNPSTKSYGFRLNVGL